MKLCKSRYFAIFKFQGLTPIFCLLVLTGLLSGCVTANRPNVPLPDPIEEICELERRNPLLASELRKLPEIQDGLASEERAALERIAALYREAPSDMDTAFQEMYEVGLPEHRAYCSPLQALFWMAMDRPLLEGKNPVKPYSLTDLLDEAWTFLPRISPEMLRKMVNGIKRPELRKSFEEELASKNPYLISFLMNQARYVPEVFEAWIPEKLDELQKKGRWSDYNEVLTRLNAPELVDYYAKKQIGYRNYWKIPGYSDPADPRYVFRNKAGDCLYISTFVAAALRKNGYNAWVAKKPALRACDSWHAVCVFKDQGERYIIDDGRGYKRGIMKHDEY